MIHQLWLDGADIRGVIQINNSITDAASFFLEGEGEGGDHAPSEARTGKLIRSALGLYAV